MTNILFFQPKIHNGLKTTYTFYEVILMKQFKCYIIGGIIFTLLAGTFSHFLYEWTNQNFIIGLFAPVNESIWEHMKLIFFPMLFYSFIINFKFRNNYPCITSSLSFSILLGTLLIPIFFYMYTKITGQDIFFLDIITFILSTIIAFFAVYKLTFSCKIKPYAFLLYFVLCVCLICFLLFTYNPPNAEIFANPAFYHTSSYSFLILLL